MKILALLAIGLIAGCAEDRIPEPHDADPPTPPPTYDLATEEGAAQALAIMLAASDTAAVRRILTPDADLVLEPGETSRHGWPVTTLLPAELRQALLNLLTGLPVSVPGGGLLAGVDSLRVSRWDLGVPFAVVADGGREGGYRVGVTLYAVGDTLYEPVAGWLMVRVVEDTLAGEFRVAGLRDMTGEDPRPAVDAPALSLVLVDYLANRPATVAVAVTPPSGPPGTRFTVDAGASRDPEGGPLEFRFRIGDTDRPWTGWSSEAVIDTVYLNPATWPVTAAARDRWLLQGAGFATITVVP